MLTSAAEFKAAAAKRRKTVDVEVEGLGTVRLRALSAGDAQQFQTDVKKAKADGENEEELAFRMIARSWIGEDGALWFTEAEGVDVARSLDPETYNTIAKAVLKLNGLAEGAVDDAAKNSGTSPDGSTPTGSPVISGTPTLM